ncbi:hypothetical protein D3C80_497950 [compost metagenome]
MATYDYTLRGPEPDMVLQGVSATDADARREAILFLSEMMREQPIRDGGAFALEVVVSRSGRNLSSGSLGVLTPHSSAAKREFREEGGQLRQRGAITKPAACRLLPRRVQRPNVLLLPSGPYVWKTT